MTTAIIFIITLGVLIFVHELGHFVVARRNGIKAEEFGFGFPPRIFGIQKYSKNGKLKKWRMIWGNHDGDDENEIEDHAEKTANNYSTGTIYSLNWLPLGGFVRIKGENGDNQDADSFTSKGAWPRIKVLAAGVLMNFILAWVLIAIVMMLGAPEAIDADQIASKAKIQVSGVSVGSPAEKMGLKVGDEILLQQNGFKIENLNDIKSYINANKGQEIFLQVKRGKDFLNLQGTPRVEATENQGALGISYAQIVMTKYSFFPAIWGALKTVVNLLWTMLVALYTIIRNLIFGNKNVGLEVTGPVGIVILTKQVSTLGLVYVLQFIALLSINLGLINILPIPALDGGRILFILIEKIKGSPVSQKIEQNFHTAFFVLLLLLMAVITFSDVFKLFK